MKMTLKTLKSPKCGILGLMPQAEVPTGVMQLLTLASFLETQTLTYYKGKQMFIKTYHPGLRESSCLWGPQLARHD